MSKGTGQHGGDVLPQVKGVGHVRISDGAIWPKRDANLIGLCEVDEASE